MYCSAAKLDSVYFALRSLYGHITLVTACTDSQVANLVILDCRNYGNKTLVEKSISSLSHSVMCKNCKSTKYFKHVCHFIPTRAKYKGRSRERYCSYCRKSSFPHHCLGLHFLGRSLQVPCWSWSQEEFSYVVGIIM